MAVSLLALDEVTSVAVAYTRERPAWTFDVAAIERACAELGVRGRVRISCANYERGRWQGMYSHADGVHSIRVARWASALEASRTLWHELTHAQQQQEGRRAQVALSLTARRRLSSDEYDSLPNEREAVRNECHARTKPLVASC